MVYAITTPGEGTIVKIFPKRNIKSRRIHGLVQFDDGKVTEFSGYFKDAEQHDVLVGTRIRGTRVRVRDDFMLRNAERKW